MQTDTNSIAKNITWNIDILARYRHDFFMLLFKKKYVGIETKNIPIRLNSHIELFVDTKVIPLTRR